MSQFEWKIALTVELPGKGFKWYGFGKAWNQGAEIRSAKRIFGKYYILWN